MLKTNKEIEKEFDKEFVYTDKDDENGIVPRKSWRPTFQLPDRETDAIKAFIRQTRIADLEQVEYMLSNLDNYGILSVDIHSLFQKLKE